MSEMDARVTALEAETLQLRGQLAAMRCAIAAAAGEADHRYRLGLLQDLVEMTRANWLALPIADAQTLPARQAFETAVEYLQLAFVRQYMRPESRNPPPRPSDGVLRVENPGA
jgi:hypothetical protein